MDMFVSLTNNETEMEKNCIMTIINLLIKTLLMNI